MEWCTRRIAGAALTACAVGAWACGESLTKPPPVTTVAVISPIGARLAVGRSVQLSASARDAAGTEVPLVGLTWTSSAPSVAAVSSEGVVTGLGEGSATVTAQAAGARGRVVEQVLAADLEGARAIMADSFATVLVEGLTGPLQGQLKAAVGQWFRGMNTGDFDTMQAALDAARSGIAGASDPTDQSVTATFALFVDEAYRLLRL